MNEGWIGLAGVVLGIMAEPFRTFLIHKLSREDDERKYKLTKLEKAYILTQKSLHILINCSKES